MNYDYDMTVIGGGAAGLTAAGLAASLGAHTALIERKKPGGDCTWYGCIPSKTLLRSAKAMHSVTTMPQYGLRMEEPPAPDTTGVMKHVRAIRRSVYEEADAPPNLEKHGIEVMAGRARFLDPHTLAVQLPDGAERYLTSRFVVIATGSSPAVPDVEGLDTVSYHTNETLFELNRIPDSMLILGAGPVGMEMAQAFRRLGTDVEVLDRGNRILSHDDEAQADMLRDILQRDGVRFTFGADISRAEQRETMITISGSAGGNTFSRQAESLLVAAGRTPNTAGLDLDNAGVRYDDKGIGISRRCRTSVRHIYACGDVTTLPKFTHVADYSAKIAVGNALLRFPQSMHLEHLSWCTYTEPELAHAGATKEQLQKRGVSHRTYSFPFARLDRAVTDGATDGLITIHTSRRLGKIYGVSILGSRAGDMICEYALAIRRGLAMRHIADTIHPYPSYGLGNRRAADQWYSRLLSPALITWIQRIFGYRGQVNDYRDTVV